MGGSHRGDPEARRLNERRAAHLAEAGRLAHALEILLQKANFEIESCRDLSKRIAHEEQIALGKAHGRIESRERFKAKSGHPLLEGRPTNFLYIDENGKSFPEPHKPQAVFSIGAVAMRSEDAHAYRHAANDLKLEFFGRKDVTFHEPSMRQLKDPYYFQGDVKRQREFDDALTALVQQTPFVAFGVGIRKGAFEQDFVSAGLDPYLPTNAYEVAIHMLMERYADYLASYSERCMGRVIFESQGPKEDADHQLEYARVLVDGTQWVSEKALRDWLAPGVMFTPKQGSDPMELADMLSRDIYEWVESGCTASPKRWESFCKKIYCRDDGRMGKFGIKVFPDSDIRDRIEAHRLLCGARKN